MAHGDVYGWHSCEITEEMVRLLPGLARGGCGTLCVTCLYLQTQESQWGKPLSLQTPEEAQILLKTGWQEFSSADGKSYWFHSATKRSVWSTPKEVEEMLKARIVVNTQFMSEHTFVAPLYVSLQLALLLAEC